jgi:hypothetical protein
MTDRTKLNQLKALVAEKGDEIAKALVAVAEDEFIFLDKQFIEKGRPFYKAIFETIWETAGLIDDKNSKKLLGLLPEKQKNGMVLMLMIMDVFFIVRSTYEFGDDLHKTCPDRYEYEEAATVEQLYEMLMPDRTY